MNILLINHYAGSPAYGMEYRPYYLAREWLKKGHQMTIVAASFSHLRHKSPELKDVITKEVIDGIRYLWIKTPGYKGNGAARVINIFTFVYRLFSLRSTLVRDINPDVVISSSTYPLDIYSARAVAKKAGAKLIFEVHDLWPLSLVEVGRIPRYHPLIVAMQAAENYAYRHADRVVSMLPMAKEYMQNHGMAASKFVYIPNGVDVEGWESEEMPLPQLHADTLRKLRGEGRFIIGYAGAHGLPNALGTLIEGASMLLDLPVAFVLVGQGVEKDGLVKRASQLGLNNVRFLPSVPRGAIPALLATMDTLYLGLQKQSLFRFGVSPNKLIDYMMAGKPVIQAIEAGNDLVSESGCGITVPPQDPQALVEAVRRLMSKTPEERAAMGALGKAYAMTHHAYPLLAARFEAAIAECPTF